MIPASQGPEVVVVDDGVRVPAIIDTEGFAFPYRQEAHAAPSLCDWRPRIQPQTLDQRSTFQSFNDLIISGGRRRIESIVVGSLEGGRVAVDLCRRLPDMKSCLPPSTASAPFLFSICFLPDLFRHHLSSTQIYRASFCLIPIRIFRVSSFDIYNLRLIPFTA